jgi:hypothetical protein
VVRLDARSVSIAVGFEAPPAKRREPAWAAVFDEIPRAVDLAWVATR